MKTYPTDAQLARAQAEIELRAELRRAAVEAEKARLRRRMVWRLRFLRLAFWRWL